MNRRIISKKRLIIVSIVLLLMAAAAWLVIWMLSPRKGTVTISSTSSASNTPKTYGVKTLDGTYITFNYSGKYTVKNQGPINNDLEIHTLTADTQYDKRIIASVSKLPDGLLDSYPAYKMRSIRTDTYKARKVRVDGNLVEIWVKNDGTEQTVMIPRGNKVATIAFITAGHSDELTTEVDALLSTFHWE